MYKSNFTIVKILMIVIILLLGTLLPGISLSEEEINNESLVTSMQEPKPIGYFNHTPIRIENDTGFNSSNGVASGAGTNGDPFIISGLEINGTGFGYCMYIGNTTAHFILNDSYFHNASGNPGQYYWDSAIILFNNTNGTIMDVDAYGNVGKGIFILNSTGHTINNNTLWLNEQEGIRVGNSDNITLLNNNLTWNNQGGVPSNYAGLTLYRSINSTVEDCYLSNNVYYGLRLEETTYSIVRYNDIVFNCGGEAGVYFEDADYNILENNNVSNSTGTGVDMRYSSDCTIINNTMNGNGMLSSSDGYGLYSDEGANNKYINNTVNYNNNTGMDLGSNAFYSIVRNNTIMYNQGQGVYANNMDNGTISWNEVAGNNHSGLAVFNSKDAYIHNNTIWENNQIIEILRAGLKVYSSTNTTVEFNYIHDNRKNGIFLWLGDQNIIQYNDIVNNCGGDTNIWLSDTDNNTLLSNNISDGTGDGLMISASHYNFIENNTVNNNNKTGIYQASSNYNTFKKNTISYNKLGGNGFTCLNSHNTTVFDNIITNNQGHGISIRDSENSNLTLNEISYNNNSGIYHGPDADGDDDYLTIENNTISNNGNHGIYVWAPQDTIKFNLIENNKIDGINVSNTWGNMMFNNTLMNNLRYGVYFNSGAYDNLVYHNNFVNVDDTEAQGFDNRTSLPKNRWDNGIEGNWWSDYRARYVPPAINNGHVWNISYTVKGFAGTNDSYPLARAFDFELPKVTELTTGPPYTGNLFIVSALITDNIGILNVSLEYWFGSGSHMIVQMLAPDDIWSYPVPIPNALDKLHYNISAIDHALNKMNISNTWTVVDDELPKFGNDSSPLNATTGDLYTFSVNVTDNVDLSIVRVEYWYGTGTHNIVFLTKGLDTEWNASIFIPDKLESLHYFFKSSDLSNNWNSTSEKIVSVEDNDLVIFGTDYSPTSGTTGDPFLIAIKITDKVGLASTWVEYWFGNGQHENESMTQNGSDPDIWEHPILIPDALDTLHYKFHASDTSALWNQTTQANVPISDNDAPNAVMGDNIDAYQGNTVKFNSSGSYDNIGIVNYTWSFSYAGADINLYGVNPKFVFELVGNYLVNLTVRDAASLTDSDILWVNVSDRIRIYDLEYPASTNVEEVIGITVRIAAAYSVDSAKLVYTDVSDKTINASMTMQSANIWEFLIPAQIIIGKVTFNVWVIDTTGFWNRTVIYSINIGDNILPNIQAVIYPEKINISNEINIKVEVEDNSGISVVKLNYRDVNDVSINVSMGLLPSRGMLYSYDIPNQPKLGNVTFFIWVQDINNNWNKSNTYQIEIMPEIKVINKTLPIITWITIPTEKMTGESIRVVVKVQDVYGVDKVKIEYTDVAKLTYNISLVHIGNDEYDHILQGQNKAGTITLIISAQNSNGFWNQTSIRIITIKSPIIPSDIYQPHIASSTPVNNQKNVDVDSEIIIIFNDSMDPINVEYAINIDPFITYRINWSEDNTRLRFEFINKFSYDTMYNITIDISATDASNNPLSEPFLLTFTTESDPEKEKEKEKKQDYMLIIFTIILVIIIILILLALLMKKQKSREAMEELDEPAEIEAEPKVEVEVDEESGEEQVVEEEAVVEEETVEEVAPMPIEDDQEAGEAKEPVDDSEPTDVYGCPECGATFGLSATSCPGCGITFLDYGSETEPDSEMDSEE